MPNTNNNLYKDSIQSVGKDVNQFRTDPHARKLASALEAQKNKSKDTKETEQQRYERLLLEAMQKGEFFLSDSPYQSLAKIGHYLMSALLTPPYILFYGPKWILKKTAKHLKPALEAGAKKGQETFFMLSTLRGKFFGEIQKQKSKKNTLSKTQKGETVFKQAYDAIKDKISEWKETLKTFKDNFEKLLEKSGNFIEKGIQKNGERLWQMATLLKQFGKGLSSKFEFNKGGMATSTLFSKVLEKGNDLRSYLLTASEIASKNIEEAFKVLAYKAEALKEKIKLPIKEALKRGEERAKEILEATQQFINQNIVAPLVVFANFILVPMRLASENVKEGVKAAFKAVLGKASPLRTIANAIYTRSKEILKDSYQLFGKGFNRVKEKLQKISSQVKSIFKNAGNALLSFQRKLSEKVLEKFKEFSKRGQNFLKEQYQKTANGVFTLLTIVKKAPSAFLKLLMKMVKFLREMIQGFFLNLQKAFIWMKVSVRYKFR